MAAIKLLETHARRDQFIVVGGSLFLLLAACLERQSLAAHAALSAGGVAVLRAFAVIAYAPDTGRKPSGTGFDNRAAVLFGRAHALLYSAARWRLLLFVFFPRLPGAFWALPRSEEAETG